MTFGSNQLSASNFSSFTMLDNNADLAISVPCSDGLGATKQYAATVRMGIVVVKPRLQMEEPANVGRHNPHTDTVELQGIIHLRVLVTIIIAEILMGNQVVFGATQQILTSAGNIDESSTGDCTGHSLGPMHRGTLPKSKTCPTFLRPITRQRSTLTSRVGTFLRSRQWSGCLKIA